MKPVLWRFLGLPVSKRSELFDSGGAGTGHIMTTRAAFIIRHIHYEAQDGVRPSHDWKVNLPLPGFIRSTDTREYRWLMLWSWQLTYRSGDKSQRRDATDASRHERINRTL